MYFPFWLFDCDADADITYKANRTHFWSDSNYDYTKTDHYMLKREGNLSFEKIPVDASSKMDDAYMDSIEPFDYKQLVEFSEKYLSGYYADKYDVSLDASAPRANERVKRSTEDRFRDTVHGYESVFTESSRINVKNGKAEYAMLPVWMLSKKYKDKIYTFAMNGQTGKVIGEPPVSRGKVAGWFAGISAAAFAVLMVIGGLL